MPGTRRHIVSISIVLTILAALGVSALVFDLRPLLGLDLRGGVSVTLTAPEGTQEEVLEKTVEVLQRRVDSAGVAETEIAVEGSSNVLIQLPGTEDPQRLLDLIGRTAQLQFRQVQEILPEGAPGFEEAEVSESDDPDQEVVLPGPDGTLFRLGEAAMTGESIRDASAVIPEVGGNWQVSVRFDSEGSRTWEQFTGELACLPVGEPQRQVAILLDRVVESSPQVSEEIQCNTGISGGNTVITGDFSEEEARDLAIVLTTGALPVELEQSEVRIVSPTLGRDALRAGLIAGALGLVLVMIYLLVYYRSLGLQTWLTFIVFGGITYGLVLVLGELIGFSLTLAGIAGLIVSVGIATDSNIVFFERIKEEVQAGRTIRTSIGRGFKPAWRTLKAANFVTILAAVVLYFLAVGPVRGFAIALGVATALDLAITYGLTWPMASILGNSRFFSESRFIGMRRALEGGSRSRLLNKIYRSDFKANIIGRTRTWFILSGVILTIALLALIPGIRGLTFGIDFRGGNILRVPVGDELTVPDIRETMREAGRPEAVVQILTDPVSDERQAQVQTAAITDPEERGAAVQALAEVAGVEASDIDLQSVGEKWGQQITVKALRGLGIFLVLAIIYLSLRLEPKMAAGAISALLHDLLITAGIYAVVGFEVSPATVIATLTILGYSLYDTVVVFDKIQENVALPANSRRSFADIANDSVNQVLMRSVNTSLTTLLPVGSLLFVGSALLGAETLKDLALALFVGVGVGTYSSVFLAAPVVSILKEREPRYSSIRSRVLGELEADEADEAEELPPEDLEEDLEESEDEDALDDELELEPVDRSAAPARPSGPRRQPRRQSRAERKKRRR